MGYQFAHVETYSLHGSTMKQKKGQARSTVGDVIGEAMRDDGHVSHLLKAGYTPAPPTFLHGDEAALRSIPDKIQQQLDAYNATSGKAKTRKDMHTLLAGVDSFPREVMAQKLGVSRSGLARGGITEALDADQIGVLLADPPEWLVRERESLRNVLAEKARLSEK